MHALKRDALRKMMDQENDYVLINVLAPEAFAQRHIPGSINIPLQSPDFAERVAEVVGSKEKAVVVYCADFDCDASTRAATELEAEGFAEVYDYEGGTKDWFARQAAA